MMTTPDPAPEPSSEPRRQPRRPLALGPDALEAHGGVLPDPAQTAQVAHQTAAVLVGSGRAAGDPVVTERLVAIVDDVGLSTLADLWASRPARSLPGALWRLYALREWVQRAPHTASREYAAGLRFADVARAVAGVAEPPGPREVQGVADEILSGVFAGDLAVALERAGAFCAIIAAGRADTADTADDAGDDELATTLTGTAASMQRTSEDLLACARLWRAGRLD